MGDFLLGVAVAVVAGLILALIIGAIRWLRVEENRENLSQRVCRHDWKQIDHGIGSSVVFVTQYDEECRKCHLQRVRPD
jgi:uncharacterized membrane protein YciS (DUF1049 family)